MKYSEKHSRWIYDWPTIINDLEAGLYSKQSMRECKRAAYDWVTCAVGNQCALLPRNKNGLPADFNAAHLGRAFAQYIEAMIYSSGADLALFSLAARGALAAIEFRSAKLLAEMKAE